MKDYDYLDFGTSPDPSHRPIYLEGVCDFLSTVPAAASILDAGCGGGDFAIGLHQAGYKVFGCDLNESAIKAAKARNVGQFELASLYEPLAAHFGRDAFDAIVSIEVIEHLYSPRVFAERCHEALIPGGILIISTPYWGYLKNIVLALTNRIDRALTTLWEGGHIKHFSRKTLTALMQDAGFEVIGFKGCGQGWRSKVPYLWSGMLVAFRKPKDTNNP